MAGLGFILTGVPVALSVKARPKAWAWFRTERPGARIGKRASHEPMLEMPNRRSDFTLPQAMRTSAFWMIILATTTRVAVYNSITVHFVPIMVWKGVSEQRAAAMLAAMAFMSCRPICWWVGSPTTSANHGSWASVCPSGQCCFFLAYGESERSLWAFTILFTFVEAIFPVGWATVGDFFGESHSPRSAAR